MGRQAQAAARCSCAHHDDGSVTSSLCALHAAQDPCLTMARVTGRRRKGTVKNGACTNCGWSPAETVGRLPRVTLERNNAGRLFVGLDEYDEYGMCVRSAVLSSQDEHTADSVMERRFADMCRLMAGNVEVVGFVEWRGANL